jgi:hypothetical protein
MVEFDALAFKFASVGVFDIEDDKGVGWRGINNSDPILTQQVFETFLICWFSKTC